VSEQQIEDIYELSPMQQGMLFDTLYNPASDIYFGQIVCTLRGELDVTAFQQAWAQVVQRHSALRTSFHWEEVDEPLQVVHQQVTLPWTQENWRDRSAETQQAALAAFLQDDQTRGFALDEAPLMRFALFQVGPQSHYFVWSVHHLIFDGWSMGIILDEVWAFYAAHCARAAIHLPPPRPYRDYIAWQQEQDSAAAERFWRAKLQGVTAPTPLVVDKSGVDQNATLDALGYAEEPFELSATATAKLEALARQERLTLNNLVQGAWALLLARYSGDPDVCFGVATSGRTAPLPGLTGMVGLFINTLPLRVQIPEDSTLIPWLQRLQAQHLEQEQYAYLSLAAIQQTSDVPAGKRLFESILIFENYPFDAAAEARQRTLVMGDLRSRERTNYPLTVVLRPGAALCGRIAYDTTRFAAATIRRMIGHFLTVLEGMVANPGAHPLRLPLLTPAEYQQIVVEWNNTAADYPEDKTIHQLFEEQAARTPDAIAVIGSNTGDEEQQLTYRELNERANQLAHHLQGLGIRPEALVGICVERSVEMVVGLLGILKAGGAYVPLDPTYPQERIAFMLHDTRAPVLLTQAHLAGQLSGLRSPIFCLDRDWTTIEHLPTVAPNVSITAGNLAYIIYTSGSTGQPKGVMVQHNNVSNLIHWHRMIYGLTERDRTTQVAGPAFDAVVLEVWPTLTAGATLYIMSDETRSNVETILQWFARHHITVSFLPTPLAEGVLSASLPDDLTLRVLLTGGDLLHAFPPASLPFTLANNYGPTENSVVTTWAAVPAAYEFASLPPIGRPVFNTQVYLLDAHHQAVPILVQGELYIGGDGLARGYLNRSELSAERFIQHPQFGRLYKTGDLVRWLPDGNIEFLGRTDHQVKIRGFRIELGEIEAVLSQHPAIREAVVIAREDTPGEKRLVAYVVMRDGMNQGDANLLSSELRNDLQRKLPSYMIPSAFVLLEALPLTPNGKIDRKALPAPDLLQQRKDAPFAAPHPGTEKEIAAVWCDVLRLARVSREDNFFELGGHSLLATRVVSRLREALDVDLPLRTLFEAPTIAALAEQITLLQLGQADSETLMQLLDDLDDSLAQTLVHESV
jgi:amino acid adenylation domain-containing protein